MRTAPSLSEKPGFQIEHDVARGEICVEATSCRRPLVLHYPNTQSALVWARGLAQLCDNAVLVALGDDVLDLESSTGASAELEGRATFKGVLP